jgi:hypothetical protein
VRRLDFGPWKPDQKGNAAEEILVRRLGIDEIEKFLGRERLEAGSLENAQTWCICFLHVQAPAHKIHARKNRSSAPRSGEAVGHGALKFSTSPEPASLQEPPPAYEITPTRVFVSPRLDTRHTRCMSETFSTTIFSLTLDLVSSLFASIILQTSKY